MQTAGLTAQELLALRNMLAWRDGGASMPAGDGASGAQSLQNALLDSLSPGRFMRFDSALVPVPTESELSVSANTVAYYVLASWDVAQGVPEGAMLGYRLDMLSAFAKTSVGAFPQATLDAMFGTSVGTLPTGRVCPCATTLGTGCGVFIASGNRFKTWDAGTWQTLRDDKQWPLHGVQRPVLATTMADESPDHAINIRAPHGDLAQSAGTSLNRIERTSRDQPFGVRLVEGIRLVLAVAIDARYILDARAQLAGAPGYFPFVMNGEIFITQRTDDRRLRA